MRGYTKTIDVREKTVCLTRLSLGWRPGTGQAAQVRRVTWSLYNAVRQWSEGARGRERTVASPPGCPPLFSRTRAAKSLTRSKVSGRARKGKGHEP